ncbi:MAG: hypothetical protein AB7I38_17025 [Dehalococcoidia bacterium]
MTGRTPIEMELEFDVETITIEEIELLEELTGTAFENFDWNSKSRVWLRALAYIAGRRQDASFTMDDAGRTPIMSMFRRQREEAGATAAKTPTAGEGEAADEDPTPAS